jgi:peptidyl-prolyl cis-trans isomerase B (cyclophilin B)
LALILAAAWCISCGIEAREYSPEVTSTLGDNYRRLGKNKPKTHNADFEWPEAGRKIAELQVEGLGVIQIALYPDLAPETVENFIRLTNQGFYNGTTFHRVIPGFMIQGGDPKSKDKNPGNDGRGGPGYRIRDEFSDAPHWRGVVAMANKGNKNSGGSQFFIVQQDSPHLDRKYSVFGRVITGMEVVDEATEVETDVFGRWGSKDRPIENVVVERVEVREATAAEAAAAAALGDGGGGEQAQAGGSGSEGKGGSEGASGRAEPRGSASEMGQPPETTAEAADGRA